MIYKIVVKNIFFLCSISLAIFLAWVFYYNQEVGVVGFIKDDNNSADRKLSADMKLLWGKTISQYIKNNLWEEAGDMYDSSNSLMVPLHAAFYLDYDIGRAEFSKQFSEFVKNDNISFLTSNDDIDLSREHYLYLGTRFMALAAQSGEYGLIPKELPEKLKKEVIILWKQKPARWYNDLIFTGGAKERLIWKLDRDNTPVSYCRAMIDHEMFLFAMAADIRIYENETKAIQDSTITEIIHYAYESIKKYVFYTENNGWLFQPGIWRDHPDYKYAGNSQISQDVEIRLVDNIAEDSSHSHRWPVWLISFIEASSGDKARHDYYSALRKKLENQFFEKVLVPPTEDFTCYRVNNYMDGYNGIYRFGYSTAGENSGYGPYQLSGILIDGWWGMFGTERVNIIYRDIANCFPLSKNIIDTYVGPNTNRTRNEYVEWPNYFQNGFGEINVNLVSKIKIDL